MDPDCWACAGEIGHDERPGAECVHRLSDGSESPCCGDALAERVAIAQALWTSRRGRGPVDARELTGSPGVPNSLRAWTDPVGYVWSGEIDQVDDPDADPDGPPPRVA